MRGSRNFCQGGGGGGGGGGPGADPVIFVRVGGGPHQSDKKSSDVVFFFFFFFFFVLFFLVLSLFYRSQMVNFKEKYHFSRFWRGSKISGEGGGVQLLIPYRNPYNL